jgi:hypothetical protein
MPLDIVTQTVSTEGPMNFHETRYALIYQWGYGRMDASTPASGLATHSLASCTAVVLHCASTGRTALAHSPNFIYMDTFAPIFNWVSGGEGIMDRIAATMWVNSRVSPSFRSQHKVDVVVIRGFKYADPQKAARFGHDSWMANFRNLCRKLKTNRNIAVTINDSQDYASSSAILVDKGTAHITHLTRRSSVPGKIDTTSIVRLIEASPVSVAPYSPAACQRDLFMGNLLSQRNREKTQDLHLQYDLYHHGAAILLTSEAWELLRSGLDKEPTSSQAAVIRAYGTSQEWMNEPDLSLCKLFMRCQKLGMPCEVCPQPGLKTCSFCRGAWYCGPEHQRQDWTAHKAWCKSHRIQK